MLRLAFSMQFTGRVLQMAQNGEINKKFGVYKSLCCGFEIVLVEGAIFPDCPNHPRLTTEWKSPSEERFPRAIELPSAKKRSNPAA
ncbi:MAG: hypothetical protein DMG20_00305 [Acidobacteria bacterium]|nr:MAG: hypothetical protein DMG20_00305 [Acidobacteriota bacterium]